MSNIHLELPKERIFLSEIVPVSTVAAHILKDSYNFFDFVEAFFVIQRIIFENMLNPNQGAV